MTEGRAPPVARRWATMAIVRHSLRLGRIAGIPISMNWSVGVVVVLLTYVLSTSTLRSLFPDAPLSARVGVAICGSTLFLVSLIGHELGHAVIARRNGVGVEGITLWLLGGFARLSRQAPNPGAEFRIAAAGPAANFVLSGLFGVIVAMGRYRSWPELVTAMFAWLIAVNLLLGVSNLLPGAPLDGGRILTAIIWKRTGNGELARLGSARLGMGIGTVIFGLGIAEVVHWSRLSGWGTVLIGTFIVLAARGEIAGAALRHRLASTPTAALMAAHPRPVNEAMTIEQFLRTQAPGPELARPVVRWGSEPIGYVAPGLFASVDPVERSWTPLGRHMVPVGGVQRAWTTESVAALMERSGGEMPPMVVLHEPEHGSAVGTLSRGRVRTLMEEPVDFWGRDRH